METALKQRINRTLSAANTVDGTGDVISVSWNCAYTHGAVVRQHESAQRSTHWDTVTFTYSITANTLRFLGKVRAILP